MSRRNVQFMLGVNDLLDEMSKKPYSVFKDGKVSFSNIIDRENESRLRLIIPDTYWETRTGKRLHNRLLLKTAGRKSAKPSRSELSNLLTGKTGHTAVTQIRYELAYDLAQNYEYLETARMNFTSLFNDKIVVDNFSIKTIDNILKFFMIDLDDVKIPTDLLYNSVEKYIYDIDCFQKVLLYLCAKKDFSEFFWWLFMYALFQGYIVLFKSHYPQIQYIKILDYMNKNKSTLEGFNKSQMKEIASTDFWDLRREIIKTASGHLVIAGPTLKNAFTVQQDDQIIDALKAALNNGKVHKVSILITDPIIFDQHINCGEPIREISGTIESIQETFYDIFERKEIDLHIYFLPLLQIDHAVITEEFMAFRSNKLWNRDRKYKGTFTLYLSNWYVLTNHNTSEYLAHKEYLYTIMENSTTIYPQIDTDHSELDKTTARSKHMHWRRYLNEKKYKHIYFHKLYEKQIFSYVCNTWSAHTGIDQFTPSSTIKGIDDLYNPANLLNDNTQKILLPYLKVTQELFNEAIRKHDPSTNSHCQIIPSLDLGFPNNVQRLAGGFATGMLVTWQCGIDIVPIDATVNVCTSSVFKLNHFDPDKLQDKKSLVASLNNCFSEASEEKGYSFSFTSGNHFLIIAKDHQRDEYYLVLHSSANELKNSYMGLYPVEGNWYSSKIKPIIGKNGRYFRYLKDEDAKHFIRMTQIFKSYNEQIHLWLAQRINGASFDESDIIMKHHYYMPTDSSIALGTFAEPIGETVPIFSAPGKNIYIFEIGKDNWQINLGGTKGDVCLIPHGWGQRIDKIEKIGVRNHELILKIAGQEFPQPISSKRHIECADKMLRNFENGQQFLKIGQRMIKGTIVTELIPCFEYSQHTMKTF